MQVTKHEKASIHIAYTLSARLLSLLVDKTVLSPDEAHGLLHQLADIQENEGTTPAQTDAANALRGMAETFRVPPTH